MRLTHFFLTIFAVALIFQPAAAQDWVSTITGASPLHWWRFEETEGDEAMDQGSGGLDGLYVDVELGADGLVGKAAEFEGFGYVMLDGENLEDDWTVEAIFSANVDEGATSQGLIGADVDGVDRMAIKAEQWNSTGNVGYTLFGVVDIGFDEPTPDELTHVALVGTGDGVELYVSGEFIGFDATTTSLSRFVLGAGQISVDGTTVVDPLTGLIDEFVIYDRALDEGEIKAHFDSITGDSCLLCPLDDGTLTDPIERANYVHDVLMTWVGDSNLDGEFNSADFVTVFSAGQYEDGIEGNSTWVTGDWNGDSEFDSSDFVTAFVDGGYELGPRAATAAVPEPESLLVAMLGAGVLLIGLRRTPVAATAIN